MNQIDEVLRGIGVIIDDDPIENERMANLLDSIKSSGIPMLVYDRIPDLSLIDSFGNVSFVILDWEFDNDELPAGVEAGDTLKSEEKQTILEFLNTLLDRWFIPVFVITGQTFSTVQTALEDAGLYDESKPNRILLTDKETIKDYNSLVTSISDWFKKAPSAYALKIWEQKATSARNKMFLDMYAASPDWVGCILDTIRKDTGDNEKGTNHEFGKLLNNTFSNRIEDGDYNQLDHVKDWQNDQDALRMVLQGERYIKYETDDQPDICYTGDLYQTNDGTRYYLNIRAQCDLLRNESDNSRLYLISGTEIDMDRILVDTTIKMTAHNKDNILMINEKPFNIKDMVSYERGDRSKFNIDMEQGKKAFIFQNGEIIEKQNHSILLCIAEKKAIEFKYDNFEIKTKSTIEQEAKRIGRLIPPYITKVQQKFAYYIVRQGLLPVPEELFR